MSSEGVALMKNYTVRAKRWTSGGDAGWELHVDGVGITQVDDLDQARAQARDFIETLTERSARSVDIEVLVEDPVR
jgi:hypothetical protein